MSTAKPRILLVEDYDDARAMYSLFLVSKGFDVDEAATGEQGLLSAGAHRPDLIVLDVGLPRMDGFEVARRLRMMPGFDAVPIIALSATTDHLTARARAAGCTQAIFKPCLPDELLAAIEALLAARPTAR